MIGRRHLESLQELLRGEVLLDEPLARHTTYGVGGPADALVAPADRADLCRCLQHCRQHGVPVQVLGDGSNVLVADEGLAGVVVRLSSEAFCGLTTEAGEQQWQLSAGAGLPVGRLVSLARSAGLHDLVFLAGIPGTVGGATYMNAGTTAGEMAAALRQVEVALPDGSLKTLSPADCGFAYRRSALPAGAVVTAVRLASGVSDPGSCSERIARYLQRRRATQPAGATAGCVFKNPAGEHAGRLIDAAGLKGLQRGGAQVSAVHANFIVVDPGSRAHDVHTLIRAVQAQVLERFGVALQPENLLLGFAPDRGDAP